MIVCRQAIRSKTAKASSYKYRGLEGPGRGCAGPPSLKTVCSDDRRFPSIFPDVPKLFEPSRRHSGVCLLLF